MWDLPPAHLTQEPPGLVVEHRPLKGVNDLCKALGIGVEYLFVWGCSMKLHNGCHIIIPNIAQVGWRRYVYIRKHEVAHCNGWRHSAR